MKKRVIIIGIACAMAAPMAHAGGWDWISFFGHWITPSIANN